MPDGFILKTFLKILILFGLVMFCKPQFIFAQDTLSVSKPLIKRSVKEPLKATMLAVSFPGLGQIYNRKYWKIPLVYAGFGSLVYSVGFNSSNYNKFMKAYQEFTDLIPETQSYLNLIPADMETYDPVLAPDTYNPSSASYWKDRMLQGVDHYKRYRDLSYIGIAAWYLISILDANVDASLFNYDISNNLDIGLVPSQLPLTGGYIGAGLNLSVKINF